MTESTPSWLRLLPVGLFLLLLAGAAGASLTVIHLRQEEGRLAASTTRLRDDLGKTDLRLQEMTALVAAAEQPEALLQRIGSRLVPMTEKQIFPVQEGGRTAPTETRPAVASVFTFRFASAEPTALPGMPQ